MTTARELVDAVGGWIDADGCWVCPDCEGAESRPCPQKLGFEQSADGIWFCRDCDSGYFDEAEDGQIVPCSLEEAAQDGELPGHHVIACGTCYQY